VGDTRELSIEYPVEDWKYEVLCGYTFLGYDDWVFNRKESDRYDKESETIAGRTVDANI